MSLAHWLVFNLQSQEYALPLENVVEVIPIMTIVSIAEAPPWLAGVINLRGRVLPVMDLRARLGLPARGLDLGARILVATIAGRALGLIVDAATEVLALPPEAVELPSAAQSTGLAVIHTGDRLITVLAPDRLDGAIDLAAALTTNLA